MQQLKRSYSLTDLGEPQQFDQHRFTDVTEEEAGWFFSFSFFLFRLLHSFHLPHVFFLIFLPPLSNHVQSNSDVQSARLKRVVGASLHIITTSLSLKCFLVFEEKKSALSPGSHLI